MIQPRNILIEEQAVLNDDHEYIFCVREKGTVRKLTSKEAHEMLADYKNMAVALQVGF